jgi:threonine dehydratase
MGKVFLGVQVPPNASEQFNVYLTNLGYQYIEETDNIVYQSFLL